MGEDIDEMDRIIRQFLDFARDAQNENSATTDLAALLDELAGAYRRRGASIQLETTRLDARVRPESLRRAITNLIDNALRYAGEDKPLDLSLRRAGRKLEIEVADRGPGIPASEVERIKRPFTRLEAARTDARGSGLGLAIVERIARHHGGSLALLPRPGGGLRAILHLPLSD
ncbi:sensor histidine kinase [Candidatus Dactylopiibacterium carminicum]|uniref:sensor histidine kinase n=1 Tax=Candidatus Dactylopiibacterium carminicum TaxID=857335 RepID=UPI001CC2C10C|nr:ATP-binding protein [Candidatus Dactylopiibacterium carminicum]